tara:strand:- start:31 stop:747 length:717 start_codon:yes stop_codon:yes gene_type:complete
MIKNTMCRLSDLTSEQIDRLVEAMPYSDCFQLGSDECFIGFEALGKAGTWYAANAKILTYTEMMKLLGTKDMNKKSAQEKYAAMQIEMNKLQAIIDAPEIKTGRILSADELTHGVEYYHIVRSQSPSKAIFTGHDADLQRINQGVAFHDEKSASQQIELFKLEQLLRIAQREDGGSYDSDNGGSYSFFLIHSRLKTQKQFKYIAPYISKVSFKTESGRDSFLEQVGIDGIELLIRGVK